MGICRGTTPYIPLKIPIRLEDFAELWITFAQKNQGDKDYIQVFSITEDDIKIEELGEDFTRISVLLTQEQTLSLKSGIGVALQLRVLFNDSTSVATKVLFLSVKDILKDGVISDET